jgi:hypothetical protein
VTTPKYTLEEHKKAVEKIFNEENTSFMEYGELLKKSKLINKTFPDNVYGHEKIYFIVRTIDGGFIVLEDYTKSIYIDTKEKKFFTITEDNFVDREIIKVKLYGIEVPSDNWKNLLKNYYYANGFLFYEVSTDKEGNKIGILILVNGNFKFDELNIMLLTSGFARVNKKECKKPICKEWLKYEERARLKGLGMWRDK